MCSIGYPFHHNLYYLPLVTLSFPHFTYLSRRRSHNTFPLLIYTLHPFTLFLHPFTFSFPISLHPFSSSLTLSRFYVGTLPPGWLAQLDRATNDLYYIHMATQTSQWIVPVLPPPTPTPSNVNITPITTTITPVSTTPIQSSTGQPTHTPVGNNTPTQAMRNGPVAGVVTAVMVEETDPLVWVDGHNHRPGGVTKTAAVASPTPTSATATSSSSSSSPPPPPPPPSSPWYTSHLDPVSGRTYYYIKHTGVSTWTQPTATPTGNNPTDKASYNGSNNGLGTASFSTPERDILNSVLSPIPSSTPSSAVSIQTQPSWLQGGGRVKTTMKASPGGNGLTTNAIQPSSSSSSSSGPGSSSSSSSSTHPDECDIHTLGLLPWQMTLINDTMNHITFTNPTSRQKAATTQFKITPYLLYRYYSVSQWRNAYHGRRIEDAIVATMEWRLKMGLHLIQPSRFTHLLQNGLAYTNGLDEKGRLIVYIKTRRTGCMSSLY